MIVSKNKKVTLLAFSMDVVQLVKELRIKKKNFFYTKTLGVASV